mmetsp:Transcript_125352/g.287131  ORF Transcript_125352/g.287131 Transcript_125352/m.287131 type:complete len:86 (-) Transcript_125352:53-310(-)
MAFRSWGCCVCWTCSYLREVQRFFFRVTMAAFASAGEGPLKGKEMDEVVEKLVEGMSAGTIAEEELVDRGLRVKVTRSMLAHAGS